MNQVNMIGNLTKDVEIRYTGSGKAVANFTVAVNSFKKDQPPLFLDCTAWEGLAETLAQNLGKGSKVYVSGQLTQQSWEDKEGGKHKKFVLNVRDCEFLSPKKPAEDGQSGAPANGAGASDLGEDVPF